MEIVRTDLTEDEGPPCEVSRPAIMFRRNKKPVSCEPCRISKIRCDHTLPTCGRCAKRNIVAKCYYHPAPLTHKIRRADAYPPVKPALVSHKEVRPKTSGLIRNPDPVQQASPLKNVSSESTPRESCPREHDADSAADIGFFGSTSFMSVFTASPEIINTAPLSSPMSIRRWLRDEGQHGHQVTEVDLIRMLCSESNIIELLVKEYYERSYFTAVPAPLILHALSRTLDFIKTLRINDHNRDELPTTELAGKISKNNEAPMHVSTSTTFEQFLDMFSGEACRWEFVGLVFAIAGFGAINFPDRISFRSSHEYGYLKGGEFAAEMLAASDACIVICERRSDLNDILLWLRYSHAVLASHILGDMNIHLYRRFGEFVSDLFAMGFHRQQRFQSETPFFVSETRKRIFAAAARRDKSLATYLGRPPLIHRFHCDVMLPLDLDDADILLTGEELVEALRNVDQEGWNKSANSKEKLRPATVIRLRYHTSILRERVLDISLGPRTESLTENAWELLHNSKQIWSTIPSHFRYDSTCWARLSPAACLVSHAIYLEYLYSVFQIQRILLREDTSIMTDLCSVCMQMLSAVLDLTKLNGRREEIQERYSHIFLYFGLPSAGVLAYELRDSMFSNRPMATSIPRSRIIRNLNLLVSWFETTALRSSRECGVCAEVTKVLSRLLDDTLNHESHQGGSINNTRGQPYQNGVDDVSAHIPPGQGQMRSEPSIPVIHSNSLLHGPLTGHESSEEFLAWLDSVDWGATSGLESGLDTTILPYGTM